MPSSVKQLLPHLGLLLILAAALGCFIFLFNLFAGLQSPDDTGLLARSDTSATQIEVLSGAQLTSVLALFVCLTLAVGTAWLGWQRLREPRGKRLLTGLLSVVCAAAFFALALYLGAAAATQRSLPYGDLPYDQHQVDLIGVEPLGLALLAAFILSVAVVGIVRPRLVILPVLVWLIIALWFGMFASDAIRGLNLFDRPARLQPVLAYQEIVQEYVPEGQGPVAVGPAQIAPEPDALPELPSPSLTDDPVETPVPDAVPALVLDLGSPDPETAGSAAASLEGIGAEVTSLETGGFLVEWAGSVYSVPGVTAKQIGPPEPVSVFSVRGATETGYLRTAVGDAYTGGAWTQHNPLELPYSAGEDVRSLVVNGMVDPSSKNTGPPPEPESGLLSHNWIAPDHANRDQEITVASHTPGGSLPIGPLAVSLNLDRVSDDGSYAPFAGTFDTELTPSHYSWVSKVPEFSREQLLDAAPTSDEAYLGLPANVPSRVRDLARQVTAEYDNPYLKARAIEDFLLREYAYGFTAPQTPELPVDQDPVDWFLFDSRQGTSGQLSSAFVVMARSVGIPARVASGWAIAEVGVEQTVTSDQAHQWAEVGFEDLGWVIFDPTGSRGARARANRTGVWEAELERLAQILHTDPSISGRAAAAKDLARFSKKSPLPASRVTKPLAEALRSDDSVSVRSAAGRALGSVDDASVLKPLAMAATSDTAPEVRISAVRGLADTERDEAIPGISEALADTDPTVRDTAEDALAVLGAEITTLENGGRLVVKNEAVKALVVGASAAQAAAPTRIPVFEARGSANTRYFRTAVGDVYQNGVWRSSNALELPYQARQGTSDLVNRLLPDHPGNLSAGNPHPQSASLAWPTSAIGLQSFEDRITVSSASADPLPAGSWPISLGTRHISTDGHYRPFSVTFRSDRPRSTYSWSAQTLRPAGDRLAQASLSDDPAFTQLPDNLPSRVAALASRITRDHSAPYAKAKAIESYLRANYAYAFAEPGSAQPPVGQDPIDWFLFESKEGTCGQFSSAFVILARAAGIPARVVSGWVVSPQDDLQTVYDDQAHQWAEVAFDGLGWVTFEPTAPAGAPGRTPGFKDALDDAAETAGDAAASAVLEEIAADNPDLARAIEQQLGGVGQGGTPVGDQLQGLLEGDPSSNPQDAAEALAEIGAQITALENGSVLVNGASGSWCVPGTTTRQARELPPVPVFQVTGGVSAGYLRTATGELYSDGGWSQIDPVQLPYQQGDGLPVLVERNRSHWDLSGFPMAPRAAAGLLAWPKPGYSTLLGLDRIEVSAHPEVGSIPAGRKPMSLRADQIMTDGSYAPFSATFVSAGNPTEYSWIAQHVEFPRDQLVGATPLADAAYTQLPEDLPSRIQDLALDITSGHDSAYLKAKAIEHFLRSNYSYAYTSENTDAPPPDRDPVDWFLFEAKEGTCGQFSSAFVVLARSVGLPARVVSGWAIGATQQSRTVYSNQAHQWAEVPFEGLGWITFEPTGAGGATFRSSETPDAAANESQSPDPQPEDQDGSETEKKQSQTQEAQETITEISQWPAQTRLGAPFTVGGTVTTASGAPVDGVEVEIFINKKKENGGIKIGTGAVERGRYSAEVHLPTRFARGGYQLIAHAMGNSEYEESWSDPEIKVYSGTGLQLAGPSEVSVDTIAQFSGQLAEEVAGSLADQEIQISIDGQLASPAYTDVTGRFEFTHTFVETGEHTVGARFVESDFLLGNEAQLVLSATMPTVLQIEGLPQVRLNEDFPIEGHLQDTRGHPLAGRDVAIALAGSSPHSATTDERGAFQISGAIRDTGIHALVATFGGGGDIEPSSYQTSIKVLEPVSIALDGDRVARVGHPYGLTGKLSGTDGRPLPGSQVRVGVMGGAGTVVDTDADGSFHWERVFDVEGEVTVEIGFAGTPGLEPSRRLWTIEVSKVQIVVDAPETITRGEDLILRGTVVVGSQAARDVEVVVTGSDDGKIAGRTNAAGSFEVVFPVEDDVDNGRIALEIAAPELETSVEAAIEVVSTTSIIVVPLEPARPGEPLQLGARLLDDRGKGIAGAVLQYGEGGQAVSDADGAAVFTIQIPDVAEPEVIPLTLRFDGDQWHLPVVYTLGLPVAPPAFDWLLWVGLPLALVLCTSLAYVMGRKRLFLAPVRGRGEGSVNDPPTVGAAAPVSRAGDPLEETRGAERDGKPAQLAEATADTKLAIRFPDLPPGSDRIWRLGESVRAECTLTSAAGNPLAGMDLYLVWGDPDEPMLLTTDMEGRCIGTWSGAEEGTHRVSARFQGDERHAPSSASEEFVLRGPVPTVLMVNIRKSADDLPDIWGTDEKMAVEFLLADIHRQPVTGRRLIVSIGETDQPIEVITDASGTGYADLIGPVPGSYQIEANFAGDLDYLPASMARQIELVEFREDVVRRYNDFLIWVREQVPNIPDQATPREVEALAVASGFPLDQRALEEVIARFEEADYSLHEISRARFESMYRACRQLMADQASDGH